MRSRLPSSLCLGLYLTGHLTTTEPNHSLVLRGLALEWGGASPRTRRLTFLSPRLAGQTFLHYFWTLGCPQFPAALLAVLATFKFIITVVA